MTLGPPGHPGPFGPGQGGGESGATPSVVVRYGEELDRAGADLAARLGRGGRVLAMGNGGSATDAEGLAALFSRTLRRGIRREPGPLTTEAAVLTALANDVGFDSVFSRQVTAQPVRTTA